MKEKNFPIIFDLDGTLFDCKELTNLTFPKVLETLKQKYRDEIQINFATNYEQYLGMVTEDIFAELLPNAGKELIQEAALLLVDAEFEYIPKSGKLFPHAEETLKELHQAGYPLFIASNGSKEYVHKVLEVFSIEGYFKGIYSAGGQGTESKVDLVRILLDAYSFMGKGVIAGDRLSDIEAGRKNHLTTIGCLYGFGDVKETYHADVKINRIEDIIPVIKTLSEKGSK
ncbi:HAD family hydrolase [Neobacillus mesonae]|uniref:HAD family hydrolase n=1 Tax=Neobacillus mesonae TaxID=1193713 RepID=UPI00203AB4E0|nr:HAD family hydrolase [Neobacillus mesonae]MCM3570269.1 HAD family hydrolase [Neobacillus mesonae]